MKWQWERSIEIIYSRKDNKNQLDWYGGLAKQRELIDRCANIANQDFFALANCMMVISVS